MTLEQILARAQALITEEVEVDEPVAAVARRCQVLPHVLVGAPSTTDKQSADAVQATRTCGIKVSEKRDKGREYYSLPTLTRRNASCNEGESQWNGSDSVGEFWLLFICCE